MPKSLLYQDIFIGSEYPKLNCLIFKEAALLATWQVAAGTLLKNDSLDLLAEFMGVGEEVAALTHQAMDGSMNLEVALERRLQILSCTPQNLKDFAHAFPPESRITPHARELVDALVSRGVEVYLISGGFMCVLICFY